MIKLMLIQLHEYAEKSNNKCRLQYIVLTMGSQGVLVYDKSGTFTHY